MRILVLSDIHGDMHSALRAVKMQKDAEVIVFCGDGADQFIALRDNMPGKTFIGVRGNCDWSSDLPDTEIVEVGGKKLFITHGHKYQAKFSVGNMVYAAREANADILLFGHTHTPMCDYSEELTILNPGHCGGYGATYGYIDITDRGDIVPNIVRLSEK